MKRAILVPAALAPAALGELKDWLAITTPTDDAALAALLAAALETCEAFTGRMPLEATCEEVLPADTCWGALQTGPVQAVTGVEGIPPEGARFALAPEDYAVDLDADGGAHVRIVNQGAAGLVAVQFVAGLAADWASLPDGLRHGVVRLAADAYRRRDGEGPGPQPPAAVAALWRPWRRMRIA
jgi:uncharacterized phiE125 gp8 family phage protein